MGTVATGVAKAGAGVILISGYDGGTGAAPQSSVHNAGLPWELGLAETHQTLVKNNLRSRVRLETDGKLMSGRDVAIACILGAEEFGFATAPLVTMGCVMMRVCNLDTCPVGIATQNPALRKRFCGRSEYVMNFMMFIAEELREIMAKLGIRTVDELVGRTDKLRIRKNSIAKNVIKLDLSAIIGETNNIHYVAGDEFDFKLKDTIDEKVLIPSFKPAFDKNEKFEISVDISSTNRSFGTNFGSEITKRFKNTLCDDTYTVNCKGGGGQSFGAFIPKGLTLKISGDSNDYFGKGLSGGKLVIFPDEKSTFDPSENIIIGNVALYGATSGFAYINGIAGERFCVRNSGATAVCEGCGDHGCEYMTGGRVAVLGRTGKNFAAGMSGGIAYVLDEQHDFYLRLNKGMVIMSGISEKSDIECLKTMIENHVKETGSARGKKILDNFDKYLPLFKKIIPTDYQKMLKCTAKYEEKGMSRKEAELEAFYEMSR